MKKLPRLLSYALCFAGLIHAELPADEKPTPGYDGPREDLHIYLLIGQSNMAGRASFSAEEAAVIPGVFLFNGENVFEPATNPLNRHSSIRKNLGMQKMNPGYAFSREMVEKGDGVSIGLVVNAKGGTRIEEWKKGTEFYNEALKRTRASQQLGTLKGILWHQGEGNSKQADTYLEQLQELILDLREDLGDPDLPFVAGQVFYDPGTKPHTKAINEAIAELSATVPGTAHVSSEGLTTYDNTHFDTEGMKKLGRRYAEAMLGVQHGPEAR